MKLSRVYGLYAITTLLALLSLSHLGLATRVKEKRVETAVEGSEPENPDFDMVLKRSNMGQYYYVGSAFFPKKKRWDIKIETITEMASNAYDKMMDN